VKHAFTNTNHSCVNFNCMFTFNKYNLTEHIQNVTHPILVCLTDGINVLAVLLLNLTFHQPQLHANNMTLAVNGHHSTTALRKQATFNVLLLQQPFYGPCLGLPGWACTRRNTHPLTPSWSSVIPTSPSIHHPPLLNLRARQSLCTTSTKPSLVHLSARHPPLHTPHVISPNHRLPLNVLLNP